LTVLHQLLTTEGIHVVIFVLINYSLSKVWRLLTGRFGTLRYEIAKVFNFYVACISNALKKESVR